MLPLHSAQYTHATSEEAEREKPGYLDSHICSSSEVGEQEYIFRCSLQARQPEKGGFSTAKAVLAAEARKAGKGFNPREFSSGSMFPEADAACSGQPQRGGPRGVASGLRKSQVPTANGPRGAFVPPFVKKAMAAQSGEQEEGPISGKTMDMLAGAPSGQTMVGRGYQYLVFWVCRWDLADNRVLISSKFHLVMPEEGVPS